MATVSERGGGAGDRLSSRPRRYTSEAHEAYAKENMRAGVPVRMNNGLPFRCCVCREVLVPGENWSEAASSRRKPVCMVCKCLYSKAAHRRKRAHQKALGKLLADLGRYPSNREAEEAANRAYSIGEAVWERTMAQRRLRP